jgi:hypothetical protein
MSKRILIIPDLQIKPDVPTDHLGLIGKLIADKRPDVIVQIGDFADMPSLSSYDVGKKSFEGRRYSKDIASVHRGMEELMLPVIELIERQKQNKHKVYRPRLVLTLGNHENRIARAIENDPKLEGLISVDDLQFKNWGWEVHDFLKVVEIEGVCFSHYFTTGVMGRPVTTPAALLSKKHVSCVMGHVQMDGVATQYTGTGKRITGIFAGSCYMHEEEYLGPQGNRHWHGVWMLNDVRDGEFETMQLSLAYLQKKYGEKK